MIKIKFFTGGFLLISFIYLVTVTSCKTNNKGTDVGLKSDTSVKAMPNPTKPELHKLLGAYTGNFGDNKITILLTTLTPDSVNGRSVVAGNNRPFHGTVSQQDTVYVFTATEPGDDKHDGKFAFTINNNDPDILSGSWLPNDTSITKRKTYTLLKKVFKYDPKVGRYPEASARVLKTEDVENLGPWELTFMRNEIFARHGYCFSRREMRDSFETEDWYTPYSTDITADLTQIEKKNISLLKKYEKYNQDYGDDFGR